MVDEKAIKKEFKKKAQEKPEVYYPVNFLKEKGYVRKKCKICGNYFWTLNAEREVCDDPNCTGAYRFIDDSPAKTKMDFIDTWKLFSKIMRKLGYEPIKRYPVVARWRDDMEFVIASIADFQPYVVNGQVAPPANPLVVPQFCMRFPDIENVGITGRHYTGFVMIGQHAFVPKEEYDPEKYLHDIHVWLTEGIRIPEEEIVYHEDAWAGGGNMGPSMEFFSRSLEIGNQVYMQYDIKTGQIKDLDIKVLDMGMGQERPAWFTHGTATSYEANFPTVMKKIYRETGIKPDYEVVKSFLPYSATLNLDEVENIDKAWKDVATRLKMNVNELKQDILPLAALYSIAEHTRTLLVAISDGAIPSNVGGGYNLRVIARRSLDFLEKYKFNLNLEDIFEWHATYLKPQYPELLDHLDVVNKIMHVEKEKYKKTKKNISSLLGRMKGKKIELKDMIVLYDSHGISPEMLKGEGIEVEDVPNFYSLVARMHEKEERKAKAQTKREYKVDIGEVKPTTILYWGDWRATKFKAKIIRIKDNYVVLDRTAFYPTSGGQIHDTGYIIKDNKRYKVIDVFKQDNVIIHVLDSTEGLKEGENVRGEIDFGRRKQLTQHHTSTHILNYATRKVLGKHIWQAGAEKTLEKARLDVTHYELLTYEQIKDIERIANEIVQEGHEVRKMILPRDKAEQQYGFRIYQGGAPPGKEIRIVEVGDDVEACGGTHLNNTIEAGIIKIVDVRRVQDGIVRFEFVAGKRAIAYIQEIEDQLHKIKESFNVPYSKVAETSLKFFNEWKHTSKGLELVKKELINNILSHLPSLIQEKDGLKHLSLSILWANDRDALQLINILKSQLDICKLRTKTKIYLAISNKAHAKLGSAKQMLSKEYPEKEVKGKELFAVVNI